MTNDNDAEPATERKEPVGAPIVRGDPEVTGAHAATAETFDPDDPASLTEATRIVREFAATDTTDNDPLPMLRGAAASAALVRGVGSYKAAADRAGAPVTVSFLRKWARVHDLPISIRRHIARGTISPSAAKEIARVTGDARFLLAWAVIDNDLTVDEVRTIASAISNGTAISDAFSAHGITLGELTITLPVSTYRELRRHASLENQPVDTLIENAVTAWISK